MLDSSPSSSLSYYEDLLFILSVNFWISKHLCIPLLTYLSLSLLSPSSSSSYFFFFPFYKNLIYSSSVLGLVVSNICSSILSFLSNSFLFSLNFVCLLWLLEKSYSKLSFAVKEKSSSSSLSVSVFSYPELSIFSTWDVRIYFRFF